MSGLDNTSETIRSVTAATTAADTDYFIAVSPGANPTNVALPAPASTIPGRVYIIRRDATATNVVNITGNINGNASATVAVGSAGAIGSVAVRNTGSTWLTSA